MHSTVPHDFLMVDTVVFSLSQCSFLINGFYDLPRLNINKLSCPKCITADTYENVIEKNDTLRIFEGIVLWSKSEFRAHSELTVICITFWFIYHIPHIYIIAKLFYWKCSTIARRHIWLSSKLRAVHLSAVTNVPFKNHFLIHEFKVEYIQLFLFSLKLSNSFNINSSEWAIC